MPYYCTVPRCTSMAGKVKNVSFHQFPRDEELARLWNKILKRGKPYTKYSKVCSLHFTPDDYTMTSGQKNKGQWRTLRKDAIPSQNLPSDSPVPYQRRNSNWTPPSTVIDARMHQQMAQAIYVQTMLAMQAAGITALNNEQQSPTEENVQAPFINNFTQLIQNDIQTENMDKQNIYPKTQSDTFKCTECSKCFKDPDVFILHKRTHTKNEMNDTGNTEEMLRANPILANLLKSDTQPKNESNEKNIKSIENQIMAALTANMENYLRNLSTIMTHGNTMELDNENGEFENRTHDLENETENFRNETQDFENRAHDSDNESEETEYLKNGTHSLENGTQDFEKRTHGTGYFENGTQCFVSGTQNIEDEREDFKNGTQDFESRIQDFDFNCDNEDLNDSTESKLVIDESRL